MTRKETLEKMYEKIGGTDAGWISDFQNLRNQTVGNPSLLETAKQATKNMFDWGYNIGDVDKVITYEEKIQSEFETIHDKIESIIENDGKDGDFEELRKEFEDIVDTIRISYITLNSNYQSYVRRADSLNEKIDSL